MIIGIVVGGPVGGLVAHVRDSGGNVVEIDLSDDVEVAVEEHLSDYTARH